MELFLLMTSVIIVSCVMLNRISNRLGIPMLLGFMLLGMISGSDGLLGIEFSDYDIAEQVSSVALIFIMFYGGFGTKWSRARPVAVRSLLLSSAGVVLTAGITGAFCRFVLGMTMLESFLLGSVISSTDAASVFYILRSRRLNLRDGTASLLELESGSNDPFAYMLTFVCLSVAEGGVNGWSVAYTVFSQVIYAAVISIPVALLASWALRKYKLTSDGFDSAFVVGVALVSFALPSVVGGNGYLGAYIVGIILGNSQFRNKKSLVNFFDGVTMLMQMMLFFLLGLLSFPSRMLAIVPTAMAVFAFLTLVARPAAVFVLLSPFGSSIRQQLLVAWSGLRGAASIVFAVMVVSGNFDAQNDIFHIVFVIVLMSILLQGSLIPSVARRLGMIDDNVDVLKTFSDYTDEVPVRYIQFTIPREHEWSGRRVREIVLPPETLLVLIRRGEESIMPVGGTVLCEGDALVLGAAAPDAVQGIQLSERTIEPGDEWDGRLVSELELGEGALIVLVKRGGKVVIPRGRTRLNNGDVIVINRIA